MPTFTKVNPGDPIQAHQLNQVIDALIGTTSSGVPIAVTSVNDATNYALTVQNDESGNSRALNVLKSDGTNLIRADASGVTLGSPLNLPANSITSAAIADAGIQNADLGPDVARANLLTNGGFEIWQRGNGPFTANTAYTADRWTIGIAGTDTLSVSKDTTNVDTGSGACMAVTFTLATGAGGSAILQGNFSDQFAELRGRTVAFSMRVRTSTPNAVRLAINDIYSGNHYTYSSFHTGSGSYQTLTVTMTLDPATTLIQLLVYFAASCTAYLDNAWFGVGSVPANYVPLQPADDLARCLRYYNRIDNTNSLVHSAGMATTTTNAVGLMNWPVPMAVVPTVTVPSASGMTCFASNGGNLALTAASANNLGIRTGLLNGTVASGLVAGNATMFSWTAAASIGVEANT